MAIFLDNSDTGRKIYNIMPSVSLCPTNWIREDVTFFSEHVPFPVQLKWFNLSDSDQCGCGDTGTTLHYTTGCAVTVSWLKRIAITSSPGIKFVGY
ncbi:hypothetical protein AVEN_92742-1 [Araneus ventricosus]|uniref:Uncharacterized protein n=1 Tax=Araneus ventricosus TaxID=182803 RepID=A0A4Y2VJW8_ARAVE|nr:hypothetical protein AVEN_92742-1 [Araneus ventricosus]